MELSACIVVYNGAGEAIRAAQTVLDCTRRYPLTLYLVDNASPDGSGQQLTYQLDVAGVSVSPGAACDNRGVQEPSHVLMALGGTAAEDALSTLRFSFGSANRPGDGKEAAERLIKILEQQ